MGLSKTLEQRLDPKTVNLAAKLGNRVSNPAHPFAWLSSPRVVKRTSRESINVTSREAMTSNEGSADDFVSAAINKVKQALISLQMKGYLGIFNLFFSISVFRVLLNCNKN